MGFNYGREKRKFDKEWERLEAEYAAAGMDEAAIMAMKLYDWKWFCSERVYHNRDRRSRMKVIGMRKNGLLFSRSLLPCLRIGMMEM